MPVAKELVRRGVPFVLATGCSQLGEEAAEIGARYLLRKPYGKADIETLLANYAADGWADETASTQPDRDRSERAREQS